MFDLNRRELFQLTAAGLLVPNPGVDVAPQVKSAKIDKPIECYVGAFNWSGVPNVPCFVTGILPPYQFMQHVNYDKAAHRYINGSWPTVSLGVMPENRKSLVAMFGGWVKEETDGPIYLSIYPAQTSAYESTAGVLESLDLEIKKAGNVITSTIIKKAQQKGYRLIQTGIRPAASVNASLIVG